MKGYPFSVAVQVRWRDLDANAHVNNAAFATFLEVARTELWHERFGGRGPGTIPFVVARLEVEYLRPISLHDRVEVGIRPTDIGPVKFDFEYRVEASGRLAARARTVQVCVRSESGRPVRVPAELRSGLERLAE